MKELQITGNMDFSELLSDAELFPLIIYNVEFIFMNLVFQSTFSVLSFVQVLWPDFSIWHLYAAILHYQRNHLHVKVSENTYNIILLPQATPR